MTFEVPIARPMTIVFFGDVSPCNFIVGARVLEVCVSLRLLNTSTMKVEAQQLFEVSGCMTSYPRRKQSL